MVKLGSTPEDRPLHHTELPLFVAVVNPGRHCQVMRQTTLLLCFNNYLELVVVGSPRFAGTVAANFVLDVLLLIMVVVVRKANFVLLHSLVQPPLFTLQRWRCALASFKIK